jgi:hypothetical protein
MNLNNSLEAPTNTKHIKNVKYREKKRTTQPTNNTAHKQHGPQTTQPTNNTAHKQHSPQTTQPTNNFADEILAVIHMTNNHPYVQQMIHKNDQIPSVICQTEDQMIDFIFPAQTWWNSRSR